MKRTRPPADADVRARNDADRFFRIIAAAFALLLLMAAGQARATPPSRIDLTLNSTADSLGIVVYHPTFYVGLHHIAKIVVKLNDSVVVTRSFDGQTNTREQVTACALVGAKPGDKVSVTAVCSLFGTKTVRLIVPARAGDRQH